MSMPQRMNAYKANLPYIIQSVPNCTKTVYARSAWARRACTLRALGLLLADGASKPFFYGNCCNSETESRKIVPKVGN